tara:strand:+ start:238 stop:519 length:282 start_codon:yes stop_codon:yes gene_type:complete
MTTFNRERFLEIIDLANTLSNEDLCTLINAVASRLDIYVGSLGRVCISTEVEHACMNGMTVQINTVMAQLDDMREDSGIEYGLEKIAKEAEVA